MATDSATPTDQFVFRLSSNNLSEGGRKRKGEAYFNINIQSARFFRVRDIVVVTDDGLEFPAKLGGSSGRSGRGGPKNLRSRPSSAFGQWLLQRRGALPGDEVHVSRLGEHRFLFHLVRVRGADDARAQDQGTHHESPDPVQRWCAETDLLAPAIQAAFESPGPVAVVSLWRRLEAPAVLPFVLHLQRTDTVPALPLNANFGVVPFRQPHLTELPVFRVADVNIARRAARSARYQERRVLPNDLVWPDWEQGYDQHRSLLADAVLSGRAYLAVDRVTPSGSVAKGHRGLLGRYAKRGAPRPFVRVPGKQGVGRAGAAAFAGVDLLILDAQALRGRRSVEAVRHALAARASLPSVLVVASPSDLIAGRYLEAVPPARVQLVGVAPQVNEVRVSTVGADRLAAEREFEFLLATPDLPSLQYQHLLDAARSAWWASRQSVREGGEPEVQRFLFALERYRQEAPYEAGAFTGVADKLQQAADPALVQERLAAILRAAREALRYGSVLVLTRNALAALALRRTLAADTGIAEEDLHSRGIHVQAFRSAVPQSHISSAVVSGYFGRETVDALLGSGARRCCLVFDPLEARVAWYGIRDMEAVLSTLDPAAAAPLDALRKAIAPFAPGFADAVEIDLDLRPGLAQGEVPAFVDLRPVDPDGPTATVMLDDGTSIECGLQARFDVLGGVGEWTRVALVHELSVGDKIVLLEEDVHGLFSDRLLETLDAGVLRPFAQARQTWLAIVRAIALSRKVNYREIARRLVQAGEPADPATVRSWISFGDGSEGTVPSRLATFLAFAEVLGVTIERQQLRTMHDAIRRWRTLHRKAGRDLARVIRSAYANRLDAATLARVERLWGINARQLIDGARVATVDEVILPPSASE